MAKSELMSDLASRTQALETQRKGSRAVFLHKTFCATGLVERRDVMQKGISPTALATKHCYSQQAEGMVGLCSPADTHQSMQSEMGELASSW